MTDKRARLLTRLRYWMAGRLFLLAGRLDPVYDVWLDSAEVRDPARLARR